MKTEVERALMDGCAWGQVNRVMIGATNDRVAELNKRYGHENEDQGRRLEKIESRLLIVLVSMSVLAGAKLLDLALVSVPMVKAWLGQ